jgi:sugar O-acyltransferase (sialic acid O-acetyltransferase NeuD family)
MYTPVIISQESVSDSEFLITELNYKTGDKVAHGDIILTYETSKADIDVESPSDGFLVLLFRCGDKIQVGDKVAFIVTIENEVSGLLKEISLQKKIIPLVNKNISRKAQALLNEHKVDINEFSHLSIIKEEDVKNYLKRNLTPVNIEQAKENDLIIIGARGGAKMVIDAVKSKKNYNVKYLLDDSDLGYSTLYGYDILGGINLLEQLYDNGYRKIVLAFGTISHRKDRLKFYETLAQKGWSFPNILHANAMIENSVKMGVGNIVLAGAIVGSDVDLGNYSFINTGAILSHECSLSDNVHMAPGSVLAGRVIVGSNTLIGMNATVYFDTNIGNNVTINNGLVINENVENDKVVKK